MYSCLKENALRKVLFLCEIYETKEILVEYSTESWWFITVTDRKSVHWWFCFVDGVVTKMNIYFGLRHLLLWQTFYLCNWVCAVPLEKPTTSSNSVEDSSSPKGDLSTDKHIGKHTSKTGNDSAGVTNTTFQPFSLLIQANDAKRTPKISNELSTRPSNQSSINFTDNSNDSAYLKSTQLISKAPNFHLSYKSLKDKFVERKIRDKTRATTTTEVYNELDLFQITKSENSTLLLENNSTVENKTAIMENQTDYNISSSKETVNTTFLANVTEETTQKLSTSGMATSDTTKHISNPSTSHGIKHPSSTPVTSHPQEQTTHEYYVLHHFTGFAENVPVRPHIPRHSNHHLNLGMYPVNFFYLLTKKEITII